MRIEKNRAATGQPVHVRCLGQWMTAEGAYPVVLIIDGDENNMGAIGRCRRAGGRVPATENENEKRR